MRVKKIKEANFTTSSDLDLYKQDAILPHVIAVLTHVSYIQYSGIVRLFYFLSDVVHLLCWTISELLSSWWTQRPCLTCCESHTLVSLTVEAVSQLASLLKERDLKMSGLPSKILTFVQTRTLCLVLFGLIKLSLLLFILLFLGEEHLLPLSLSICYLYELCCILPWGK